MASVTGQAKATFSRGPGRGSHALSPAVTRPRPGAPAGQERDEGQRRPHLLSRVPEWPGAPLLPDLRGSAGAQSMSRAAGTLPSRPSLLSTQGRSAEGAKGAQLAGYLARPLGLVQGARHGTLLWVTAGAQPHHPAQWPQGTRGQEAHVDWEPCGAECCGGEGPPETRVQHRELLSRAGRGAQQPAASSPRTGVCQGGPGACPSLTAKATCSPGGNAVSGENMGHS